MELKPGDKVSFRDHGTVVRTSKDSSDVIVRDVSGNNQSVPSSRILEKYALGGTLEEKTELLAREFSRLVRRDLKKEEIDEIIEDKGNHPFKDPHDYMDANMTIDEAFVNVMGRLYHSFGDDDSSMEAHEADMTLMDNAQWLAYKKNYYLKEKLSYPRSKTEVVEVSVDGGKKKKMKELGAAKDYIENETMKHPEKKYVVFLDGKPKFVAEKNSLSEKKNGNKKNNFSKGGTMSESPKIYVADLAAYNEGKLIGDWLDLSDYSSGEEVMEAIQDLLKKWSEEQGVEREEYAIHDTENIPGDMINEYSGEEDFEKVVSVLTVANDRDIPFEVILKWMNDKGEDDANNAADAYNGSYKDEEDFAYEMVQQGVISDLTPYLTMTETDRRILAGEESDNRVQDMDDDDLIREADMEDDLIELQEKSDKADNDEEKISEVKDEIEELESELTELEDDEEGNYREIEFKKAEIESAQEELAELESEYEEINFDREKDKIVDKAREKVRDQVYDEVYEALSDPVEYFVNEQGIYSQEDLAKASFMSVDYEYLARELGHDFTYIRHDGETYVFSDNYARGGKIRTPKPKKKKGMQVGSKVTIIAEKINELRKSLNPPKQTSVDKMLKNYESVLDKVGTVYEMGSRIVGVQYDTKKISILKEYLQLLPEEKNSFAKVGRVKDHSLVKVVESAKNAAKRDGYTMVVYRSDDELKYSFARKSEFERGISQGEPAVAYVNESGIVDYKYAKGGSVRGTKYPQFFEKFKRVSGYIGDPVANNAGEILFEIKPDSKSDFDEMVKYAKENKMEVRPNEINPKRALIVLKKEFAKGGLANHKSNVFIAYPYRKKYVVVDEKTNSLWANEYFTTEEEAREFVAQAELNLTKKNIQPFKAEYKLAKGGFANLEKIASGKYLDLAVQGNKLHIFLTQEGKNWTKRNGKINKYNFSTLFSDIQKGNNMLMYDEDLSSVVVGAPPAPAIIEFQKFPGEESDSKEWYFSDYKTKSAFAELNENGEVDFDLAPTFKKGGKVKFNDKVNAIASRLRGKGVPKKYRRDYGSRYDKDEAKEAARRIAGAQLRDSMGKVKKN